MPAIFKNHHAYSKMDVEDPEDRTHRRAQFLIYKTLQEADDAHRIRSHANKKRSGGSYFGIRFGNLRVKVGQRVKKLRNSLCFNVSLARIGVYRRVVAQLKTWRKLMAGRERFGSAAAATALHRPLFITA
uniref:Uncharacterized protein n=1 Tax=Kalanchoe fedtschenkoi TaxID=63787 RepID=A0A7N0TN95_KALFE